MEASVRSVFAAHFKSWVQGRRLPLHQHKAAFALGHCRTNAMGTHVQRCEHGDFTVVLPNACRSRSCPRCSALARERWVLAQHAKLLACDHYHVVFTLPHELLPLFSSQRRAMVELLFQSVRETVMILLNDPRHLGATPGLLMALHTWGRNLSHHPHVHCLVTGGGLHHSGHWRGTTTPYLLPVRVVKTLYRGKLLGLLQQALNDGRLVPPPHQDAAALHRLLGNLRQRDWQVRLKERYAHGEGVTKYLARYVKGGPISDRRITQHTAGHVTFRYRDHRAGANKRLTLTTGDFMGRVLWHLPEPHQHLVRTAGLYANRAGAQRDAVRVQLKQPRQTMLPILSWQTYLRQRGYTPQTICPMCGGRLIVVSRIRRDRNSYYRLAATKRFVQQNARTYIPCVPPPP